MKVRATSSTASVALTALAVLALGACSSSSPTETPTSPGEIASTSPVTKGPWTPVPGLALVEPEELVSENGVLTASLTVGRRDVEISGSPVIGAMTFNDSFLSPTFVVKPGDTIELDLTNELDQETNLHYHGFHVTPGGESDNIFRHVMPGETAHYQLKIPANHEQGLFWYHSHAHGISESQVAAGLSGLIRIGDVATMLPYQDTDLEQRDFAIRDLQMKDNVVPASNSDMGQGTQVRLVNGQLQPTVDMQPGETQLWRIGNIGADQFYDLVLADHTFHVVGEDGNPVARVWKTNHLVLPPGKRFEVLVQAGDPGTYDLRTVKYDQGEMAMPDELMATLNVSGDPATTKPIPESIGSFIDLANADIAKHRTETFSFGCASATCFKPEINGKLFNENVVNVTSKLGTVEEWTLRNTTGEEHPFHIHVNDFQVMSVNGKPYNAAGYQDTVIIPAQDGTTPGEVVIRMPFDDYAGKFVFHCHILGHEDAGMMAVIEVV